ncbi:MAG: hypothetical protein WAT19_02815 [Ferruginibacter sp.]
MKKSQPSIFVLFAKSVVEAFNNLFFAEDKEFQRLKNFIAS